MAESYSRECNVWFKQISEIQYFVFLSIRHLPEMHTLLICWDKKPIKWLSWRHNLTHYFGFQKTTSQDFCGCGTANLLLNRILEVSLEHYSLVWVFFSPDTPSPLEFYAVLRPRGLPPLIPHSTMISSWTNVTVFGCFSPWSFPLRTCCPVPNPHYYCSFSIDSYSLLSATTP